MQIVRRLIAVLIFGVTISAEAFPEMIRLGYVNCTACHVAPTGGGLMTDYGRSISAEALSTWASPKEELPGHGFLGEPPAWLKIGGDIRLIQTYVDNAQATSTSAFPMQMDLELGFNFGKLWFVQGLGIQGGPDKARGRGEFVAHRYYAMYNATDVSYGRAGKFLLPFGLNIPDHTAYIKRSLGFDQGQETYNLEMGSIDENLNVVGAISFGRKDNHNVNLEKGASVQIGYNVGDTHKLMGSFAYMKSDLAHRYLLGPQILWAFNAQWTFLGEYDYQEKTTEVPTRSVQKGAVTYSRLQYEWTKGFNTYLLHQFSYLDFTQLNTRINSAGIGLLWYPRPHFELIAEVDYSETAHVNTYNTVSWLLGHYYF